MKATIVSAKEEVQTRLEALDVPEILLREAIESSERLRLGMSPNHPPIAFGFMPWSELVCALRDRLLPLSWTKSDEGGLPRVVHPSGKMAIAVLTGDEGTGIDEGELRSKNPRGPLTRSLVAFNAAQLEFDDLGFQVKAIKIPEQSLLTWYLMLNRTKDGVRFELSLPYAIGADGRVVGWKERIFFSPVTFEADKVALEKDIEVTEDIEIQITPKL